MSRIRVVPTGVGTGRVVVDGLPPIVFGIAFLLVWQFAVQAFDLKPYFLPAPTAISEAFFDNIELIRDAALVSGTNALIGLIAGTLLGVGAGVPPDAVPDR